MEKNKTLWMVGSYTTGATYYCTTEEDALAIANDPDCYSPDDPYVFIEELVDAHPCYSKFPDGTEICHAYDCICINHGKCNSCAKDIAYWEAELNQ